MEAGDDENLRQVHEQPEFDPSGFDRRDFGLAGVAEENPQLMPRSPVIIGALLP